MGGVDLIDKMIAYYHPDLRCRRNWIPILIQIPSIVQGNSYIVHRFFFQKKGDTHKKCALSIVTYLMNQAHIKYIDALPRIRRPVCEVASPKRRAISPLNSPNKTTKRPRLETELSYSNFILKFPGRKIPPWKNHVAIKGQKRGSCIVWEFIYNQKKRNDE